MTYLTRSLIPLNVLLAETSAAECGGTCVFLGTVRDGPDEHGVTAIEYSAYEEMVEGELGRGRAGSYRHGGRGALVGSPGRRAAPAGADPSGRGEHRDRRCGAAPGARVRGVSLRDRRGEAARARVEEGTAGRWERDVGGSVRPSHSPPVRPSDACLIPSCATRSAARSAVCGSRSPTAATCGAATACRRTSTSGCRRNRSSRSR